MAAFDWLVACNADYSTAAFGLGLWLNADSLDQAGSGLDDLERAVHCVHL
jgi:hypothetical protein